MEYQLTEKALDDLGFIFTAFLKEKIKSKIYPYGNPNVKGTGNKIASGNLYDSIGYSVEVDGNGIPVLLLSYATYFKDVNKGRKINVKRVPLNVLLKWIKIKGIRGRDKKGRFIKNTSFAYAIQTNIYKYGIRPTNIYDKTLDSVEDLFNNPPPEIARRLDELYNAIEQDINNFIEATIEKEI